MKPIEGYFLIKPEELEWKPAKPMKIPNADFLERTKSEILGARLWRFPPKSANTLHKHVLAEEFYFVPARIFHTCSSRDAAKARLARRPKPLRAGLYGHILSGALGDPKRADRFPTRRKKLP